MPTAGRIVDRGHAKAVMTAALLLSIIAWPVMIPAHDGRIAWLIAGIVLINVGHTSMLNASQSTCYELRPEARSRLNAVFMTQFFAGGAAGGAAVSPVWSDYEWIGTCVLSAAWPAWACSRPSHSAATERRAPRGGRSSAGCGIIVRVGSRSVDDQRLRDLALLRRVRDRMDREYARPLNVAALARGVNMSAGHLSRQFRAAYGESPYSYLMTRRIERAMALLRRGGKSVTEVCFEVGCSSLGTFSTRFTELVGMSPSAYKERETDPMEGMPSCVVKRVTRPIRNREAQVPGAA